MASPQSSFYEALERFSRVEIYVNALRDVTVPYRTGGIDPTDPFQESRLERGEIQVEVDPNYPVLISSFKHLPPSPPPPLWKRIKSKLSPDNLPWFLNPSRLPVRFPLNYIIVLFLPILFPTFVVLVLWRFRGQSRESRKRVSKLGKGWQEGQINLENDQEDQKSKPQSREKERIEKMLRRIKKVAQVAGEENVESENPGPSVIVGSSSTSNGNAHGDLEDQEQKILSSNIKTHPPLTEVQIEMCNNLNAIKQMKKHRTWFEGVINSESLREGREGID